MNKTTIENSKRILSFIQTYWTARNFGPALDDIAKGVQLPKTTVNNTIATLELNGMVTRPREKNRAVARQMRVTPKGKALINGN